jgi:outer membrane lipoprotein SlyB
MKKLLATLLSLVVLSMTALPAVAQTRGRCVNRQTTSSYDDRYNRNTSYDTRYDSSVYRNDQTVYDNIYGYDNRSVWQKHRDKITTAGGAAGGALLGGLIGGKKGAIIGAITGGAGAAVYTYKIRDRYRRY